MKIMLNRFWFVIVSILTLFLLSVGVYSSVNYFKKDKPTEFFSLVYNSDNGVNLRIHFDTLFINDNTRIIQTRTDQTPLNVIQIRVVENGAEKIVDDQFKYDVDSTTSNIACIVGGRYILYSSLYDENDPFDKQDSSIVIIKEKKNGYVRYYAENNPKFVTSASCEDFIWYAKNKRKYNAKR